MPDARNNFAANLERFTGFAEDYDRHRAPPPDGLAALLLGLAGVNKKDACVVDLGSGTGLSTRYWSGRAAQAIGVEPTAAMRDVAVRQGGRGVSYRDGFSHATGLPAGSAQVVVCMQALHWMDPEPTFREARRLLTPGGVLASCDYDWPPDVGSAEVQDAYRACEAVCKDLERTRQLSARVRHWDKPGHAQRMRDSGLFRRVDETTLSHSDPGDAERLVGLLLSQGFVQTVKKAGVGEDEMGLIRFRQIATSVLGATRREWTWTARVRFAVV